MDNPLFNSAYSPSPTHATTKNPTWAADELGAPSTNAPTLLSWEDQSVVTTQNLPTKNVISSTAAAMGRDRPEEGAFADALGRLIRGEASAPEIILAYDSICRSRAAELRSLANAQAQRAPRFMALSEAAAELEAEANTWQLLWFLYGNSGMDFPAGSGGDFVQYAGFAKTFRQLAADLLFKDDVLNRAGRAVAWLESLSTISDPEPEKGLGHKDGLWQETKAKIVSLQQNTRHGSDTTLVSEIDPDATTRQGSTLDMDNTRDEERMMRMIWKLIRSGRTSRAMEVCQRAGQPWRAASLAGAWLHGPLPLGHAAEEADQVDSGLVQEELLSDQAENGHAFTRALWKWACYQASEKLSSGSSGTGDYEAAVYAVLSGHISRVLPACTSWEDFLWAHLRCWLDCAVDAELSTANGKIHFMAVDAVPSSAPPRDIEIAAESSSAASGGWPLPNIRESLPSNFNDMVEAGGSLFGGALNEAHATAAQRFRRIQLDLIQNKTESMVSNALVRWIIDSENEQDTYTSPMGLMNAVNGKEGIEVVGPRCPPSLMRFAAHLALMLWSLGVAVMPLDPDPAAAYSHLHDLLQRLVQVYTVHLIDSGAFSLVPLYACCLRAGLRRTTYLLFLEQLLAVGDVRECKLAYLAGQNRFKGMCEQGNGGDVATDEMLIIARKAAGKAQMESQGGPIQRARSLLWLCMNSESYIDTVRWACVLCREFSLGGPCGAAGAVALLCDVLPAGVGGNDPLEKLFAAAQATGMHEDQYIVSELRAWLRYFEFEVEYSSWQTIFAGAVNEILVDGRDPADGCLSDLARDTIPLLHAALELMKDGCSWLSPIWPWPSGHDVGPGAMPSFVPGEVAIVVGPDNSEPAVLSGDSYPVFGSVEEQNVAAAVIIETLQRVTADLKTTDYSSELSFQAGPAPQEGSVHLPGLVSIAVDCREDVRDVQDRVCEVLSAVVKGTIGSTVPLLVTNLSANPYIVTKLIKSVLYPRMALRAAVLRHALAYMGHMGSEEGAADQVMHGDLANLFAPHEVKEIQELEARVIECQKKNKSMSG